MCLGLLGWTSSRASQFSGFCFFPRLLEPSLLPIHSFLPSPSGPPQRGSFLFHWTAGISHSVCRLASETVPSFQQLSAPLTFSTTDYIPIPCPTQKSGFPCVCLQHQAQGGSWHPFGDGLWIFELPASEPKRLKGGERREGV